MTDPSRESRAGVVLAGGRSTRFGEQDKAVADLAGTPMVRRVTDRLARVVDTLVVNCRADQKTAIGAVLDGASLPTAYAVDPDPDAGPMAGIRTGLRAVPDSCEYAMVVACDMPFLDTTLVDLLFARAAGHDAAVPRPGEWYETTQAVYRTETMADACDRALARGESKILAPLDELDWVVVDADELDGAGVDEQTFENVNTTEELERAAARLGG